MIFLELNKLIEYIVCEESKSIKEELHIILKNQTPIFRQFNEEISIDGEIQVKNIHNFIKYLGHFWEKILH